MSHFIELFPFMSLVGNLRKGVFERLTSTLSESYLAATKLVLLFGSKQWPIMRKFHFHNLLFLRSLIFLTKGNVTRRDSQPRFVDQKSCA